ncbi:MAG: hypothetical protein ACI81P_002211 [Neolewinella sp.]|jgi:hypothetical protein
MNTKATLSRYATLGIPLALLFTLVLLMQLPLFHGDDILNLALTADLLLTVPVVYLLLIRKTAIPNTTVVPVMVLGLLLGLYFMPEGSQVYLQLFKKWALPVIEISVLAFVVFKVRAAVIHHKREHGQALDFFTAVKSTALDVLPQRLAVPFATEIAVFYYGFFAWKSRDLKDHEFSYHKKSGTPATFGAFIFMIGVETAALHLLLAEWNALAAWVLTGLSIYTAVQLFGFGKSLSRRPVYIQDGKLHLRYGILSEVEVPLTDIAAVALSRKPLAKDQLAQKLSPLGDFESHNVVLTLNQPCTLTGLYGRKKEFQTLGLHLDQPKAFKAFLEGARLEEQ